MSGSGGKILDQLYDTIATRRGADPEKSYTAKLFDRGRSKITQKFGEEAMETVVAALTEAPNRLIGESADMLYHLLVLWADCGIRPADVWSELEKRQGISGLDEKKNRKK
jgi:phosphoribosyl-ATP pyrophosphohydrolase